MATRRTAASRRESVRGLADDVASLIRDEIAQVRDETVNAVKGASLDLGLFAAAGGASMGGVVALAIALTDAFHGGTPARGRGLPLWAAAGLAGTVMTVSAAGLAVAATRDLRRRELVPHRALQSIEETVEDAAGGVREGTS